MKVRLDKSLQHGLRHKIVNLACKAIVKVAMQDPDRVMESGSRYEDTSRVYDRLGIGPFKTLTEIGHTTSIVMFNDCAWIRLAPLGLLDVTVQVEAVDKRERPDESWPLYGTYLEINRYKGGFDD